MVITFTLQICVSLSYQLVEEDDEDEERGDVADEIVEDDREASEVESAAVCKHIDDLLLAETLHKEAHEDAADRHGELCNEEIEEIEESHSEDCDMTPIAEG